MQDVKIPVSDSYHNYLIESLKDPEEAAAYLEVALEEGSDQPQLLKKVISNILEAHSQLNYSYDSNQINREKLDQAVALINCIAIYNFMELVDLLGFKISIQVKEPETAGNEE
ncbi:helix-turn-helix domain-containing transcriptional regulator [Planktothrix mougeotii]|uniref:Transcriptional regulator n=1 Tax=Planktothrix mougeotii LEGE 06226 TaxID=1828728 RepID=A0ABR9U728_9CYAN|nr:transcriptional regulator [Planktothrix mougeotii]MBE9142263.1 transcriptional regulator [Planktothrix mougeotii LEGE 06226]